jgi:hypothetical protein
MKTNRILLGGLTGGVVFFLLGWIVYGMLLMDYMTANCKQCAARPMQEMIWWAMILSNMALGFLIALVLSWSETKSIMAGAKVAGIIGLLLSLSIDLSFYSMTTMYSSLIPIFVDVAAYTVMSAITGTAIVSVMGLVKKGV